MPGGAGTARNIAPGTKFGFSQLESYAMQAGFSPTEAKIAASIALAESGGNPAAVNPKSGATGLWQLMPSNIARFHVGNAKDPAANARGAYAVYKAQGWSAWTTYGGTAQKKFFATGEGPTLGDKVPVLGAISSTTDAIGNFVQLLTSPDLWKRLGLGLLGALMVIGGILIMVTGDAKAITKNLPPVIPV